MSKGGRRFGLVENLLLTRSRLLFLDTSALLYFLDAKEPYITLLLPLFGRVQRRECNVVVSAITEAEMLVRPNQRADLGAIERISGLLSEDGIQVSPMDRRTARRAALLRALHDFALPDAIIIATAIEMGCEAIVGNDAKWRRLAEIPYVHLGDVIKDHGLDTSMATQRE